MALWVLIFYIVTSGNGYNRKTKNRDPDKRVWRGRTSDFLATVLGLITFWRTALLLFAH